jgi:hypothetical protein
MTNQCRGRKEMIQDTISTLQAKNFVHDLIIEEILRGFQSWNENIADYKFINEFNSFNDLTFWWLQQNPEIKVIPQWLVESLNKESISKEIKKEFTIIVITTLRGKDFYYVFKKKDDKNIS